MNSSELLGLIVAALGGTAVGLERQRSGHADGLSARFAGIRTFTMLGALAGLAGWLWVTGVTVLAATLLGGAVAITVSAYIAASRQNVDGTTEVSALIVMAAGVLAGMGSLRLASGIIAVEVLLLVEKSRLHALATRIDDVDLRSGVRFGVMALVILPLLPEGPYGPFGGVRPRELWALVLFFSGLSFLGHVLRRIVGPGRGYLVSGLIGGLVSSTNVTLTFARLSRRHRSMERALAFGAVGANAVLYPRVLAAVGVLNPALLLPVIPYLAAPALVVAIVTAVGARKSDPDGNGAGNLATSNPLQLSAAVQMALLFQAVIMVVGLARARWGQAGMFSTAAVLGLTEYKNMRAFNGAPAVVGCRAGTVTEALVECAASPPSAGSARTRRASSAAARARADGTPRRRRPRVAPARCAPRQLRNVPTDTSMEPADS